MPRFMRGDKVEFTHAGKAKRGVVTGGNKGSADEPCYNVSVGDVKYRVDEENLTRVKERSSWDREAI